MREVRLNFIFCLIACTLNCGSDTSDNNAAAGDTRQLKDVPQSDLIALCKQQETRLESLADPCTGAGLEESTKAACETAHDACLAAHAGEDTSTDINCDGADVAALQDCTATVSELDSCLSGISDYAHRLSCDAAGSPPAPPACFQQLSAACPNLFK